MTALMTDPKKIKKKKHLVLFMCMLYMVIESKNLPCQGMHATPLFP